LKAGSARPPLRASLMSRRRPSPNGFYVSAPRAWPACRTVRLGPRSSPSQTAPVPCARVEARVEALRRHRCTGKQIAAEVGVSAATVSRILKRLGLNRLAALEPGEPVRRYDRNGQSNTRGVGWESVHLAIDDHSRVAYSEILPDEKRGSCLLCLQRPRFFRSLDVKVRRVMTDNGSSFRSRRYAKALRRLKIKHLRTRPYTPKTNGKAERFVQTSLREWAYAQAYPTSDHRAQQLPLWLHRYNWHRPHGGIGSTPPINRLALTEDNLLRLHNPRISRARWCW
jgi:transposase InsO family protein